MLAQQLRPGEFLLTAHHEDDQLETVLLQLLRGAGIAGLAAMPECAPFASGWLARPLLSWRRAELEGWVRAQGLTWVDDSSNTDERFDRNYLRAHVLPRLRERWPGAGTAVSRTARLAAEGQRLLDSLARNDVERASNGESLSVQTLRALPPDRRRNALRFWISRCGARVPDHRRLEEIAGPLIAARPDSNPRVAWSGSEVHRHADMLSIQRVGAAAKSLPEDLVWRWSEARRIELPWSSATLEIRRDAHGPIDLDRLPGVLQVRRRRGGERIRIGSGATRRSLKNLLQETRVPPAQRALLPFVFAQENLVAVGSLWVDAAVRARPGAAHRGRLIHRAARP